VTQRGNRRERVFFSDAEYALYRDLLHEACAVRGGDYGDTDYGDTANSITSITVTRAKFAIISHQKTRRPRWRDGANRPFCR
jgi:hypothetical protein